MTTIPYGKLASAIKGASHDFVDAEKIMFIDIDSEVNVNCRDTYYIFKSLERVLTQTLTDDEFEWFDQ